VNHVFFIIAVIFSLRRKNCWWSYSRVGSASGAAKREKCACQRSLWRI